MTTKQHDDFLGLCPTCHEQRCLYNFGGWSGAPLSTNMMSCEDCKTCWIYGTNVFTSTSTEADDEAMWAKLDNYTVVEPYYYPETIRERLLHRNIAVTLNKDGSPRKKRDEHKNLAKRQRDMKARMELARRKDTGDWKTAAARVQALFNPRPNFDKTAAAILSLISDKAWMAERAEENDSAA